LIGPDHPRATGSRGRCDCGEGECHACQERQTAFPKGLIRPRKYERQHGQDARADDRQNAAQEGKHQYRHGFVLFKAPCPVYMAVAQPK
jgi:hypothetical protein